MSYTQYSVSEIVSTCRHCGSWYFTTCENFSSTWPQTETLPRFSFPSAHQIRCRKPKGAGGREPCRCRKYWHPAGPRAQRTSSPGDTRAYSAAGTSPGVTRTRPSLTRMTRPWRMCPGKKRKTGDGSLGRHVVTSPTSCQLDLSLGTVALGSFSSIHLCYWKKKGVRKGVRKGVSVHEPNKSSMRKYSF